MGSIQRIRVSKAAAKLWLLKDLGFSPYLTLQNGFTGCRKTPVLYQGTTLVGP
jgi:hypothetical protein